MGKIDWKERIRGALVVKTEQTNVYLLAIVAIVAIVGIVVLILNSGIDMMSGDMTGQAYIKLKAKDDAAGLVETTAGQQVSGIAGADSESGSCPDGKVYCGYCRSKSAACAAGCTQHC